LKFCHAVFIHQTDPIEPSPGEMFFQGKKEACCDGGSGRLSRKEMDAGKCAFRRQEKEMVTSLTMKHEDEALIGTPNHLVHPRSGKEDNKLIDDFFEDIKIQSAFLPE
jgi:hypothetical protein